MSSSTPPNVVFHDHGSSSRASPRINVLENSYPRAIVWGPLGPLTCCCPCVGHMGIGDSTGRIHDFAGPYYIGIDDFMVGCVLRYAVIPSDKDDQAWDESIARADEEYRKRMHNICCDNWCARAFMHFFFALLSDRRVHCSHSHHHTGLALTLSGKPQWGCGGLLSPWLYCCLFGRCTLWHCLYPPAPPEKRRMFMGGEEMERGV